MRTGLVSCNMRLVGPVGFVFDDKVRSLEAPALLGGLTIIKFTTCCHTQRVGYPWCALFVKSSFTTSLGSRG